MMRLDEKRTYWGLSSFIVNPNQRGQGIGSMMLESLKFTKPIYLNVKQDNRALDLYKKHKFKVIETKNGRHHMKMDL
jgi:ribosomal protein S18 acetylase RimI-like enzyme